MTYYTSKTSCPSNKILYRTLENGWRYAIYYYETLGTYSSPYRCRMCHYWHLTSKSPTLVPVKYQERFAKHKQKLLELEWRMLKKILGVKTHNERKREKKRLYKQTYKPRRFNIWWLKIRNRYFRWLWTPTSSENFARSVSMSGSECGRRLCAGIVLWYT